MEDLLEGETDGLATNIPKRMEVEEFKIEAKSFFEANKRTIGEVVKQGEKVVKIDFQELSAHSPEVAEMLIERPEETLQLLEESLEELEWAPRRAKARFMTMSPSQETLIRTIRSKHLGKMIGIEGIVRQASEVRPLVTNARFSCPSCETIISVLQIEKKFKEPSRCSCGRRGGFKLLSKDMADAQVLTIEEASDNLSGGEQPKRMTIMVQDDLVDPRMETRTTPGSRVRVIGILKEIALSNSAGAMLTRFDLAIEANNIIPIDETFEDVIISEEDERDIRELASRDDVVQKLVESIAPSVWGEENVKKALAFQLFGGVKKLRSDGTKMRGDIHILLVGDPGVAKSVMLDFIQKVAPKARSVSGKSTSGAGLTAAVVKDDVLKGWGLEAGAMVLANKGLVCIDEFDKMTDEDRSTMHEAMESQTITIAKATVQATLQAQTSVLAAANPKYGRFDPTQPIPKQVNLPPALLSRFDSIFILRDIPGKKRDTSIAMRILQEHQQTAHHDVLDQGFIKKYISYSKKKYNPILSEEAAKVISDFYVSLRSQAYDESSNVKAIPIGARQIQALVRLSEAHARIKLHNEVTKEDALEGIALVRSYLMEVGFDEETQQFDIDKQSGHTASSRNKINVVKEIIESLENRIGKLIPLEEIEGAIGEKITLSELEEIIDKLVKAGDLFKPKRGFIQRV
ncbi:MAG: replicative DNA helicase Mcm [Patescibacteria group bacterium]|jgi:replicative DNA helicase Mcm